MAGVKRPSLTLRYNPLLEKPVLLRTSGFLSMRGELVIFTLELLRDVVGIPEEFYFLESLDGIPYKIQVWFYITTLFIQRPGF